MEHSEVEEEVDMPSVMRSSLASYDVGRSLTEFWSRRGRKCALAFRTDVT